jgi:hypothetical protein
MHGLSSAWLDRQVLRPMPCPSWTAAMPPALQSLVVHVQGGELYDQVVAARKLPEIIARYFFQQLIIGVEYCHSQVRRLVLLLGVQGIRALGLCKRLIFFSKIGVGGDAFFVGAVGDEIFRTLSQRFIFFLANG